MVKYYYVVVMYNRGWNLPGSFIMSCELFSLKDARREACSRVNWNFQDFEHSAVTVLTWREISKEQAELGI